MKYSVERFINDDIGITMNKFAIKTGYSQSKLSSWKNRNHKLVINLPAQIIKLLSEESKYSMEEVYQKLSLYEDDWLKEQKNKEK